jgi:hypothetical protein
VPKDELLGRLGAPSLQSLLDDPQLPSSEALGISLLKTLQHFCRSQCRIRFEPRTDLRFMFIEHSGSARDRLMPPIGSPVRPAVLPGLPGCLQVCGEPLEVNDGSARGSGAQTSTVDAPTQFLLGSPNRLEQQHWISPGHACLDLFLVTPQTHRDGQGRERRAAVVGDSA